MRLKVSQSVLAGNGLTGFQFYNSAIKRGEAPSTYVDVMIFQFYNSAIKRKGVERGAG